MSSGRTPRLRQPRVFVSYRRGDSGGHAGRLHETLSRHYGNSALFLDHEIGPGREWQRELDTALDDADVLLAVIGPDWVSASIDGERRLDDPEDWVRREVEAGLGSEDVRVIPVLVGDATMPSADDLPESLRPLLERQAVQVRPNRHRSDATALIRSIGGWRSRLYGLPVLIWPALVVVLAVIVALVVALATRRENSPPEVASELSLSVTSGQSGSIDVLDGASDDDGEVTLADVDPASAEGGAIETIGDGIVEYTAPDDFHGIDSFRYRVADSDGERTEGVVEVIVEIGPMVGDFNVAIAAFEIDGSPDDPDGAADRADELSRSIHDRVADELEALNEAGSFNFEIRPPEETGAVTGSDQAERAAAARTIGREIDADVVVYGVVDEGGVRPAFFVIPRNRNLPNAEELAGDYELGARILGSPLDAGSITANSVLRDALAARARALTQFVIGLSWYADFEYANALAAFEAADVPEWEDADGKEIVHLFVGNAAGKLRRVDQAEQQYALALGLNADFARAMVGSAEVEFFRSAIVDRGGACQPGDVDPDGLDRAESLYRDASVANDRPEVSNVDAKTDFGLGRIALCRTLAGLGDEIAEADAAFERVVADHDAGNDAIAELASESLANQALLVLIADAGRSDPETLERAVALYERAEELTPDPARRDIFARNRCDVAQSLESPPPDC